MSFFQMGLKMQDLQVILQICKLFFLIPSAAFCGLDYSIGKDMISKNVRDALMHGGKFHRLIKREGGKNELFIKRSNKGIIRMVVEKNE